MDKRSRRQKLEAMANQTVSPEEAKIAKSMLAKLPKEKPPVIPSGTSINDLKFSFDVKYSQEEWDKIFKEFERVAQANKRANESMNFQTESLRRKAKYYADLRRKQEL